MRRSKFLVAGIGIWQSLVTFIPGLAPVKVTPPCDAVLGRVSPDLGSGACTGNFQTVIRLPTAGNLVHNSLSPSETRGFGNGFNLALERTIVRTPQGWTLQYGDGTSIPLRSKEDASQEVWLAQDPRMSQSTFFRKENLFSERDANRNDYRYEPLDSDRYLLSRITDRHGKSIQIKRKGQIIEEITDPFDRKISFHIAGTQITTITDAQGANYMLFYDGKGRLIKIVFPDATDWDLKYEEPTSIVSIVKAPDGSTLTLDYYPNTGFIKEVINQNRISTRYKYTADSVTVEDTFHSLTERFSHHSLISKTIDGVTTKYGLDPSRRVISQGSPFGSRKFTYEGDSYRLSRIEESNGSQDFAYASTDDPTSLTITRNGISHRIDYQWDEQGNLTTVSIDGKATVYTYNNKGDLVSAKTPAGRTAVQAEYDGFGHPTKIGDAFNHWVAYHYDDFGNLSGYTDALGKQTRYTRNALGFATRISYPDGVNLTRSLDFMGRPKGVQEILTKGRTLIRDITWKNFSNGAVKSASESFRIGDHLIKQNQTNYESQEMPNRPSNLIIQGENGNTVTLMDKNNGTFNSVTQPFPVPAIPNKIEEK